MYPDGVLPLECALPVRLECEQEFFATLPTQAAVFLLEPRVAGASPYLGKTANLRRRMERLLREPAGLSRSLNLRAFAGRLCYRLTGSAFEQDLTLYALARHLFPQRYRELLRLRRPVLLKVNLRNPYPRCSVTRRLAADGGFYFGPFASRRAADRFAAEFLDRFKIRRCQIRICRDPSFPGCIYSEMNMCLAPCFAGCTEADYRAEVDRVLAFLSSRGRSLSGALEQERNAASQALDFERAAVLHRRLERVEAMWRGLPELVAPLHRLHAVILQRAAEGTAVLLFPLVRAELMPPLRLDFAALADQPRSAEQLLREQLETLPLAAPPGSPQEPAAPGGDASTLAVRADHLSLLARWYYSQPRQGEIVFAAQQWPYRKILRACSRLLRPRAGPAAAPPRVPPGA
ncbi:MAG: UvrB/UvrC motif-containing protein [Firmicutes bacterium]|nr:UvrB/UvrC motif-containing protein [Bacillota bacterium]